MDWDQLVHSEDWILFEDNIGENLSLDETSLSQGEIYTILTNKSAKGKKGAIPSVSSERRNYIPIGFMPSDIITSNLCLIIPDASVYNFGVLTSNMHMAWVKYTCGRLKSDFRYSKDLVYNNYPWPKDTSDKNQQKVEEKAQKVLDVRAEFPESSLADLYDPLTMPPKLIKAHQELDKAVDLCYRPQAFTTESSRLEFLFDLYNEYTQLLFNKKKKKKENKYIDE